MLNGITKYENKRVPQVVLAIIVQPNRPFVNERVQLVFACSPPRVCCGVGFGPWSEGALPMLASPTLSRYASQTPMRLNLANVRCTLCVHKRFYHHISDI